MTIGKKMTLVGVGLSVLLLGIFGIWGGWFEEHFSQAATVDWLAATRTWGWLVILALLAGDLVLPIPATPIMAAAGAVYGLWGGAAVAAAGSTLAGLSGYALARWLGVRGVRRIARPDELARFAAFFNRWGVLAVIASRPVPILPEVMSVLAGLAPMRFGRFVAALLLGTIPSALLFAYIGQAAVEQSWWLVAGATAVPMGLWGVLLAVSRRMQTDQARPR